MIHWSLQGGGIVLAQPVEKFTAMDPNEMMLAITEAERLAMGLGVRGKELTPFLLKQLAEITDGQTLRTNHSLVVANARLAAQISCALTSLQIAAV